MVMCKSENACYSVDSVFITVDGCSSCHCQKNGKVHCVQICGTKNKSSNYSLIFKFFFSCFRVSLDLCVTGDICVHAQMYGCMLKKLLLNHMIRGSVSLCNSLFLL